MTVVYVLAAFLVGWLIGFFDSNLRSSKKIKAAEEKAGQAVREAEKRIAETQPEAPARLREPSVLNLMYINGAPFLEFEGAPLDLRAVSADQKRRVLELLALIRSWLEGGQPAAAVPQAAAPAAGPAAPLAPHNVIAQIDAVLQARLAKSPLAGRGIRLTQRTSSGGVLVHVGAQSYQSLSDVPDPEIKAAVRAAIAEWEEKHARPSTASPQPATPAVDLTYIKPPPPARPMDERGFRALSIVAQIDTLLQARLENTPLANRGIRLIERTSLGGVEVYVGDQKYPSLDDVPDQEIKSAIRATIAEWERKYTPGA